MRRSWGWQVKAFEAAIRKALHKVDSSDAKVRARIYQSARDALAGSQEKQGVTGTDEAARQYNQLEELIGAIDREYAQARPAAADVAPPAPPAQGRSRREPPPIAAADPQPGPPQPEARGGFATVSAGDTLRAERLAPPGQKESRRRRKKASAADPLDAVAAKGGKQPRKRRRPFWSLLLVAALAIAFVGMAALYVVFNGLFLTADQRDSSIPNPPATVDGGDFAGGGGGADDGEWINIFLPDDLSGVSQRVGAQAAPVEIGRSEALQIISSDPGDEGEVLFEIDPAALQPLVGGKAMVVVTVRTSEDTPSQMYVRCTLPGDEDCGRHRFNVNFEVSDVVFSLDLTGKTLASGSGFLAINSDISGNGQGVDVFAIRARPL